MEVYIGVDPGVTGAIVGITRDGKLLRCDDIPAVKDGSKREVLVSQVSDIFNQYVVDYGSTGLFVTLEKHTPRPGQGISSQCKLARICGQIEGIVASLGISYQIAHPRTWSKVMRDVEGIDLKARSMVSASRRFPDLDLSLKKHHNRADAALIAEYGRIYHDTPV